MPECKKCEFIYNETLRTPFRADLAARRSSQDRVAQLRKPANRNRKGLSCNVPTSAPGVLGNRHIAHEQRDLAHDGERQKSRKSSTRITYEAGPAEMKLFARKPERQQRHQHDQWLR